MSAQFHVCQNDADRAEFVRYFIKNRNEFNRQFTLADTLLHILQSLHQSRIMLIKNGQGHTVGWMFFKYVDRHYETNPQGEIVFIDSAIMNASYRGGRLFFRGFRLMANYIQIDNPNVKQFEFRALESDAYLNKLYGKFASVIGQSEGNYGLENIFSTDFTQLLRLLNQSKNDNLRHFIPYDIVNL
ncbi:GNAT family N-acetyltransferase [Paenibacillus sp. 2TAB23]|uniref:GNAT family N-acetyltransferase n=1 Tax=Paenibacillus sp. 2TAB23 TaxID=3233004 RepID=UPI003F9A3AF7